MRSFGIFDEERVITMKEIKKRPTLFGAKAGILSLLLVFSLALSGCSGTNSTDSTSTSSSTSSTDSTSSTQPAQSTSGPSGSSESSVDSDNQNLWTPLDTTADDGVAIKSKQYFSEEEKAEVMKAYAALKRYLDKYMNVNLPNASKYIVSIDDVRRNGDLSTHYDPSYGCPAPTEALDFHIVANEHSEQISANYLVICKINGEWTTYAEYKALNNT